MLENIHIQNFRCFEDFKAEGFERINLIGGKNNSGKTCLLEGIQCINRNLITIAQQRGQELISLLNKDCNSLETVINFKNNIDYKININYLESASDYTRYGESINTKIQYIKGDIKNPDFDILEIFENNEIHLQFLDNTLIEILKIIQPDVDGISSFIGKKHELYISVSNKLEPLSNFGDAIKHLLNYFIHFVDKKISNKNLNTILLIDEIENGIHYSAHYDFWKAMFKLSKELNVQIFATTHSLEMIQQFSKVANEEGEAAYFEMFKNEQEDKIKCIKHETDILEYELETKENLRGEQL